MKQQSNDRPAQPGAGPFTPPTVEEMNAVLGEEFLVESVIGQGGMAVVYKGIDRSDEDRQVAIKVLPKEIALLDTRETGFDYSKRFEREAEAMARLSHPNLVQVYKYGKTSNDMSFFTMEYVDGDNLHGIGQKYSEVSLDHIYSWLIQICDGLAYAHEQGIVHRDIKPGNILINTEGVVKIADFGLVKVNGRDSMHSMETVIAMGTPDFSAPEIVDFQEKGDHRSDIFSVGILAYQLFTGMLPKGLWEPPSSLLEGADRRLDRIIDSALRSNKAKRYQSIAEMRDDLKRIAPESVTGLPSVVAGKSKTTDSALIQQKYFPEVSVEHFQCLLKIATDHSISSKETVVEKGCRNEQLILLTDGNMSVLGEDDKTIADLEPGSFVGEMSYLTGNRPTATVVAATDCHYMAWEFSRLRELCQGDEALKASVGTMISSDLVEKLTG